VVELVKILLLSITMQKFDCCVSYLWAHVGGPKIWRCWSPTRLGKGSRLSLLKDAPHNTYYHTEIGRSMSNGMNVHRDPKFWGGWAPAPWDGERGWPRTNSVVWVKRCPISYGDPTENWPLASRPSRPAFHGHVRSLKPTCIGRLPMTSY